MYKVKRVPKIEYWKSVTNGEWYGHILGTNGRVVWHNVQGYKRRAGVTNAIRFLITYGFNGHVTEIADPNANACNV